MNFNLTPENIQLVTSVVVALVGAGKLVVADLADAFKAIFRRGDPTKTDEELNAIVADTMARADVREALSRAEAGQVE